MDDALGQGISTPSDLANALNIRELQEVIRINPNDALAHFYLGDALRPYHLERAIREYQAAIRIYRDSAPVHYNLANAVRSKTDLKGVIREFQEVIRLDPNNFLAHLFLGDVLKSKNDLKGAIRAYQEVIRLQKDYAPAYHRLAWTLANAPDPTVHNHVRP